LYTLSNPSQTTAKFNWAIGVTGSRTCSFDAYIPTKNAGVPNARYDFWGIDSNGTYHWLGWPGHGIDQQTSSGWLRLATNVGVHGYKRFAVVLSNQGTAGWYVGAGDGRFMCN